MKKELPRDLVLLRRMLKKLKNDEARLEAALAVRKFPELEEGIVAVIVVMSEVQQCEKNLKIMTLPVDQAAKQIETLTSQIDYYSARIETVKGAGQLKLAELYESRIESAKERIKDLRTKPDAKFEK